MVQTLAENNSVPRISGGGSSRDHACDFFIIGTDAVSTHFKWNSPHDILAGALSAAVID
ncbi:MAG TPA: hypothetical protein VE862_12030 [Candidatus Acidoferrum sp.]|nr:hypothetical protein [Candidatus Acidoferrum sp.]